MGERRARPQGARARRGAAAAHASGHCGECAVRVQDAHAGRIDALEREQQLLRRTLQPQEQPHRCALLTCSALNPFTCLFL